MGDLISEFTKKTGKPPTPEQRAILLKEQARRSQPPAVAPSDLYSDYGQTAKVVSKQKPKAAPSPQMRVLPNGEVRQLSTTPKLPTLNRFERGLADNSARLVDTGKRAMNMIAARGVTDDPILRQTAKANPKVAGVIAHAQKVEADPANREAAMNAGTLALIPAGMGILGRLSPMLPHLAEVGFGAQGAQNLYRRATGQAPSPIDAPIDTLFDLGMLGAALPGLHGVAGDIRNIRNRPAPVVPVAAPAAPVPPVAPPAPTMRPAPVDEMAFVGGERSYTPRPVRPEPHPVAPEPVAAPAPEPVAPVEAPAPKANGKKVKAKAPKATVKQPWEMTQQEFDATVSHHATNESGRDALLREGFDPAKRDGGGVAPSETPGMFTGDKGMVLRRYGTHTVAVLPKEGARVLEGPELNAFFDRHPELREGTAGGEDLAKTLAAEGWDALGSEDAGPYRNWLNPDKYEIVPDHRFVVERALAEGKPVPPEVLADYPDLTPSAPAPAATPAPVAKAQVEAPAGNAGATGDLSGLSYEDLAARFEDAMNSGDKEAFRAVSDEISRRGDAEGIQRLQAGVDVESKIGPMQEQMDALHREADDLNAQAKSIFDSYNKKGWTKEQSEYREERPTKVKPAEELRIKALKTRRQAQAIGDEIRKMRGELGPLPDVLPADATPEQAAYFRQQNPGKYLHESNPTPAPEPAPLEVDTQGSTPAPAPEGNGGNGNGAKVGDLVRANETGMTGRITGEGKVGKKPAWKVKMANGEETVWLKDDPNAFTTRAQEAATPEPVHEVIPPSEVKPNGNGTRPPAPPKATEPAPEPAPAPSEAVGIRNEALNAQLAEMGQPELTDGEVRHWSDMLAKAKREGTAAKSEEILQTANAGNRAITDDEAAGVGVRLTELSNAIDAAAAKGDTAAQAKAQAEYNRIAQGIKTAKGDAARALNIAKIFINKGDYTLAEAVQKAMDNRGGSALKPAEMEALKTQIQTLEAEKARLQESARKDAERVVELERQVREQGLEKTAQSEKAKKKAGIREATAARKAANAKKLEVLVGEWKARHSGESVGKRLMGEEEGSLDLDDLRLLGKIARVHMDNGAATLNQVVQLTMASAPGVTEKEIIRAIAERNPDAWKPSEAMKRRTAIQNEARLLDEIEKLKNGETPEAKAPGTPASPRIQALRDERARLLDEARKPERDAKKAQARAERLKAVENQLRQEVADAEKGKFKQKTKGTPRVETPAIAQLRAKLKELRAAARAATRDKKTLAAKMRTIDEMERHLQDNTRPAKGKKAAPAPEIADANRTIGEYRRILKSRDTLADLQEQVRTNNPKETAKRPSTVTPGGELERNQIAIRKLRREIKGMIGDKKAPLPLKILKEANNASREAMATADVSATARQGKSLTLLGLMEDPKGTLKAHKNAWKSLFSDYGDEQVHNRMVNDPDYQPSQAAGLDLQERGGEEFFQSHPFEKIPGLGHLARASERHMRTLMNELRFESFKRYRAKNPDASPEELKAAAHVINIFSGRGDLGKAGALGDSLSLVMFAPRYKASRWQYGLQIKDAWKTPALRKMVLKTYAGDVGFGLSVLTLAKLAGAKVGINPDDADFGKIVIGNTRYDIWAGEQQVVRPIARLMLVSARHAGLVKSKSKGQPFGVADFIGQQATNGAAPWLSFGYEMGTGTNMATHQPVTPLESIIGHTTPMGLGDTYDAYQSGGLGAALPTFGAGQIGLGVSTYKRKGRGQAPIAAPFSRQAYPSRMSLGGGGGMGGDGPSILSPLLGSMSIDWVSPLQDPDR